MEPEPMAMGERRLREGYAASPKVAEETQAQESQGPDLTKRLFVNGKTYQDDGFGVGRCMVRYKCPVCKGEAVLNAYRGQPYHHGRCDGAAMEPQSLVLETNSKDPRGSPHRGKA